MADTSTLGPKAASCGPPTATIEKSALPGSEFAQFLPRGSTIGRYVVLERIGLGGMGAIYSAYDPELDRRVALKVLRWARPESAEGSGSTDSAAAARLLGEARALARLEHPNVLRVYDVGSDRGQVFVTTELLVGLDVAAWSLQRSRSWQEIVDVFLAVGQGLAAAHAEGLVHCDIKPANMMVCDDGRVLLVDFGIAADAMGGEGPVFDSGVLGLPLGARRRSGPTAKGAGTPGYMAPEQMRGEEARPAADIYAFCLSLSRVLFGRAPNEASEAARLEAAEESSKATPKAVPPGVARPLRSLLERGTQEDPAVRPGSVEEVLSALRAIRTQERRRLLLAAMLGISLLLLFLGRFLLAPPGTCFDGDQRFTAVWNEARRAALSGRFAQGPTGRELFAATGASIESYGRAWRLQGEEFCREGRRGASSALLLDLRLDCLDQRLRELDASLALATSRQGLEASRVADMFTSLVPLEACADTRALRAATLPVLDPAQRRELDVLRSRQASLRALWTAGVMREGSEAAQDLLEGARVLGHLPLIAEVLYQRGLFEDALVEEKAAATLQEAALTAAACHHDRSTAESLIRLVRVAGLGQEHFEEARHFVELARVALGNLSRPGLLAADLDDFEGLVARQQGDYPRALKLHLRALEGRERELGVGHPALARSHLRLGNLLDDQDQQTAALVHFEKALAIQLAFYGSGHPAIAETYTRLGTLAREEGRLEEARSYHEKALALRLEVLGEGRPPVAESRTYLGELAALRGDLPLARQEFAAASAILVRELGAEHSRVGVLLATEASAFTEAGLDREAIAPYERALAIFEKSLGGNHPQVGVLLFNLGAVHLRLAEYAAALRAYQRAGGIFEASLGTESSLYWNALAGKGEVLERLGRDREARQLLEQVLVVDERLDRGAKFRADTLFALARVLLRLGGEREKASELALHAMELYRQDPQTSRRELVELEVWLARGRIGQKSPPPMPGVW